MQIKHYTYENRGEVGQAACATRGLAEQQLVGGKRFLVHQLFCIHILL